MGVVEFSNIGCGGRDDKNTALLSGMFDRYSVLRFLNWIKSSLESRRKKNQGQILVDKLKGLGIEVEIKAAVA